MARISKEEQERIRDKIVDVASVYFQENGFEQTSTKMIAKEVGIAEGTLFNYFDSKTELFLEVFAMTFAKNEKPFLDELVIGENITEVIMNHLLEAVGLILKIPRVILAEFGISSIKMAKKSPKRFKKFVDLDFRYMEDLAVFIEKLIGAELFKKVDTKLFSEIVYSIIMYEVLLYIYDTSIPKDALIEQIKSKIHILITGYIIQGGSNEY